MKLNLLWLAAILVAADNPLEPLPEMSSETIAAIAQYKDCVVSKSLALEPAGETAAETVKISIPTCSDERLLASVAITKNFGLADGKYDAGRMAVITFVNSQLNDETANAAKLAIVTKRAARSK